MCVSNVGKRQHLVEVVAVHPSHRDADLFPVEENLVGAIVPAVRVPVEIVRPFVDAIFRSHRFPVELGGVGGTDVLRIPFERHNLRSEEHTSELQSLMRISYAVFCLQKKNNINTS